MRARKQVSTKVWKPKPHPRQADIDRVYPPGRKAVSMSGKSRVKEWTDNRR